MMKNTLGEARKYIFALAVVLGGGGCHDMGAVYLEIAREWEPLEEEVDRVLDRTAGAR